VTTIHTGFWRPLGQGASGSGGTVGGCHLRHIASFRFSIACLVACLVLAVCDAAFLTSQITTEQARLDQALTTGAGEKAALVEAELGRAQSQALLTARIPPFSELYADEGSHAAEIAAVAGPAREINEALSYLWELNQGRLVESGYVDASGRENARIVRGAVTSAGDLLADVRTWPSFPVAAATAADHAFITAPFVSPSVGVRVVAVVTPVVVDDKVRAYVELELAMSVIEDQLSGDLEPSEGVLIVDASGRQVAGVGAPLMLAGWDPTANLTTLGPSRIATRVITHDNVVGGPWYVVAGGPSPALLAVVLTPAQLTLMLLALTALVLAAASARRARARAADIRAAEQQARDERRERELAQAQRNEERFRSLVQNSADIILILDGSDRVSYQSPSAEHAWGYDTARLLGRRLSEFADADDESAIESLLVAAHEAVGVNIPAEVRLRFADGVLHTCEAVVRNLLDDPSINGIVATLRDITERKQLEAELTRLAFRDPLTGLANRALFGDRLEQALQRAERHDRSIGLLFLDLDNFKLVNDGLGHHAGDRVLAAVADRLRLAVREEDSAARIGGDEFTVLVEEISKPGDALEIANRITEALRPPILIDDRELVVSASIGIALSRSGDRPDGLIRSADLAMYRAKISGKAQAQLFDATMETTTRRRLHIESDLRRALDRGEFAVHYQPIVDLASGRWIGLEALLRWQHPGEGIILPGEFIPLAEELGLIVPMGQWAIEQATLEVRDWRDANGLPLSLSVNLSPRQFRHPGLIADIERALATAGMDASRLILEITESALMDDTELAADQVRALADLGISIAIDDYGTGYSSLGYLRRFPVDVLKIDRSFVSGLPDDEQDIAIVRNVLALAADLGLGVTAEGIETEAQRIRLLDLGCQLGQGYLFAKPMPAAAIVAELERLQPAGDRLSPARLRRPRATRPAA
jgi:diguanylate cyclase (GGDEF)-like protein/PAS domain S-box-containing protein